MSWLLVAVIAYFFLALVNIGDKLFLGNFVPNYKAYTTLVGILGLAIFVIAPWFLSWPGLFIFAISILSGVLFIAALLAFFFSLQTGEASRVIPFVGGLIPIFSLILAVVFLKEIFVSSQWLAFGLLVLGSILIVRVPHRTHWWGHAVKWFKLKKNKHHLEFTEEIFIAVSAAVFFASSFVSSKFVYDTAGFLNGFIWVRLGSFLAILVLLFNKDTQKALRQVYKKLFSKTGAMFLGNQGFGAIGFTLQGYAISLGSVALVNAMQGVQYVFVIALAVLASIKFPKLAREGKFDIKIIVEKLIAVLVIAAGLWILTIL